MLDERDAVNEGLDTLNRRRPRPGLLWMFAFTMAVYAIAMLGGGGYWSLILVGLMLAGDLVLLRLRLLAGYLHRNVRPVATAVLIGHLLLLQLVHPGSTISGGILVWFCIIPLLATRFRFAPGELLALFGSLYAVLTARVMFKLITEETDRLTLIESTVLLSIFLVVVFLPMLGIAWGLTQRLERRFVTRWRAEAGRHRERLRMKRELEYARQIQLSMLPAPGTGPRLARRCRPVPACHRGRR